MLKKDQTDIVKPHEVNDDELLQVHTQEYMNSMKVSLFIWFQHLYDGYVANIWYVTTYQK